MDVFRIVGIAAAAAVLALTVKSYRPELGIQIAASGGIILLGFCLSELIGIDSALKKSLYELGMGEEALAPAIKAVGIAYVTQIGADLCRDSGESALAAKTEICGRALIASAALPTLLKLVSILAGMIDEYV